jgi:type II secretory pathway pseudopilin PulG
VVLGLQNYRITKLQKCQRGYMLITLMLALSLIAMGMLTVLPEIAQQIRRDREEELRHRGSEYMRAIQHFYKKFGRYPVRIEELENTNNLRFIRKRYTDPMSVDPKTGKERDFKLLHQMDISLNSGTVLGQTPGQSGLQGGGPGGLGGAQGVFGALEGAPGGLGTQTVGAQNPPSGVSSNSSSGNSSFGNSSDPEFNSNSPGLSPSNSNTGSSSGSGFNGQTFGGGPIIGVASTSEAKTVRVFYQKDHYKDWLFIYLPQLNNGSVLVGPVRPGFPTSVFPGSVGGVPGQGTATSAGQPQSVPTQSPQNPGQPPPQN